VRIVGIAPQPSDDEAAAIAAALARAHAPPPRGAERWRQDRERKPAGYVARASLEYYVDVSWQEAARFESLDAGV
jgi:hypothetical protein